MFVKADLVESKLCLTKNLFRIRKDKISRKEKKKILNFQNKMIVQKNLKGPYEFPEVKIIENVYILMFKQQNWNVQELDH